MDQVLLVVEMFEAQIKTWQGRRTSSTIGGGYVACISNSSLLVFDCAKVTRNLNSRDKKQFRVRLLADPGQGDDSRSCSQSVSQPPRHICAQSGGTVSMLVPYRHEGAVAQLAGFQFLAHSHPHPSQLNCTATFLRVWNHHLA
jgi:hypothetical protein